MNKLRSEVLAFFMANPGPHTPCRIHRFVFPDKMLTSVRARITELTDDGKLEKLDVYEAGLYGKPAHTWRYARSTPEQGVLL